METINIDVGVYTTLKLNLKEYNFDGVEKVIFTVKNFGSGKPVIVREFTAPLEYNVSITPEESVKLKTSAEYGFTMVCTDGKTYKASDVGKVKLCKCVGGFYE